MAKKGGDRHMKRIAAPIYPKIMRKISKYITKPNAGRHSAESSIALITVLKEKLGVAKNSAEGRKIIKSRLVYVNSRVITDEKYPVGFGDIIYLKPTDEYYRVGIGRYNTFLLEKISKEESERNIYKVVGKYIYRGNIPMLRLHNGNVTRMEKDANVGDSVVIEKGKIIDVIRFKEGAECLVINGIHSSSRGVIKSIIPSSPRKEKIVEIASGNSTFQTTANNVMVTGA